MSGFQISQIPFPTHNLFNIMSTGLHVGGLISVNTNTAKFDVTAGNGVIVNNSNPDAPIVTEVHFDAVSAQTTTTLATSNHTMIFVTAAGVISQQPGHFTAPEYRTKLYLGTLVHPDGSAIIAAIPEPIPATAVVQSVADILASLGGIKDSGQRLSANGANLKLNVSAGISHIMGANFANDPMSPNDLSESAITEASILPMYQDGSGDFTVATAVTAVDPLQYDDGDGGLATLGANKFSIQRVFRFVGTGQLMVYYGRASYNSLAAAEASLINESFDEDMGYRAVSIYLGALVMRNTTTSLQDTSDVTFMQAGSIRIQ